VIEDPTHLQGNGTRRGLVNEDGDVAVEPGIQPDSTDLTESCGRVDSGWIHVDLDDGGVGLVWRHAAQRLSISRGHRYG
jgi:hypothetical protein